MEPTPELGPAEVCKVVCAGMKHINDPFPDAGITRLYNWMTAQGRVSLAPPPPKSGLQGGVTLEYFLEEAAGPAIGTFMECAHPLNQPRPRHPPSARPHAACVWHATAMPPPLHPPPSTAPTHAPIQVHALRACGRADGDGGHAHARRASDSAHRGAASRPSFRLPPSTSHLRPPTSCLLPLPTSVLSRYGALGAPLPAPPPPPPCLCARRRTASRSTRLTAP